MHMRITLDAIFLTTSSSLCFSIPITLGFAQLLAVLSTLPRHPRTSQDTTTLPSEATVSTTWGSPKIGDPNIAPEIVGSLF